MSIGWDEPRCVWCHKTGGTIESVTVRVPEALGRKEQDKTVSVHIEHEAETKRYYRHLCRYARLWLAVGVFGIIMGIFLSYLNWIPWFIFIMVYFGVITIVVPHSDDLIVELAGIKSARTFNRVVGVILVLSGFSLLYLNIRGRL